MKLNLKNTLLTGISALCLVGGSAVAVHAHAMDMGKDKPAGHEVTLRGEVLDMDCFMNEGAHGPGHQDCAVMCLNNGAPVGLLTADGKAYFLTANEKKGMMKYYTKVRDMGGDQVEITGQLQERAGTLSVRIDNFKKL
ncbi:MAG: hypothetical protein ACREKE_10640 [bacterium]